MPVIMQRLTFIFSGLVILNVMIVRNALRAMNCSPTISTDSDLLADSLQSLVLLKACFFFKV